VLRRSHGTWVVISITRNLASWISLERLKVLWDRSFADAGGLGEFAYGGRKLDGATKALLDTWVCDSRDQFSDAIRPVIA
jgi:hypothetical protein